MFKLGIIEESLSDKTVLLELKPFFMWLLQNHKS